MDLSKMSESDLRMIERGDMRMMSADGLRLLAGGDASPANDDKGVARNAIMGALKGASDIGATLLSPLDATGLTGMTSAQRRSSMKQFFGEHANPDTLAFKGGDLAAAIAGTAGVGGVLGHAARAVPMLAKTALPAALETGGMMIGKPGAWTAANTAARLTGGAVTGAATAGLVNPDDAIAGGALGAAFPVAAKFGGEAGKYVGRKLSGAAENMMRSALKPVLKAQQTGDADVAVRTMLDNGLNVTKSGVEKLRNMVDDVNTQIEGKIAYSPDMILKDDVLKALDATRSRFGNQVSPASDLAAIDAVASGFRSHPRLPSDFIPIQQAQEMKQGTYSILRNKYGQLGSAETEAQKALARGLKEEIAKAVPGIADLNAKESSLLKTLKVAERRVLMDMNKNPMGLSLLASNPATWAAFMADRSDAFKSIAARMANSLSGYAQSQPGLFGALQNPVIRTGLLVSPESP